MSRLATPSQLRCGAGRSEGVQRPVSYKREICGYFTEHSDTMLAMLANGYMPEKYKQKTRFDAEEPLGRWRRLDRYRPPRGAKISLA